MMKINDLTLHDLIRVAEDESLSEAQSRKVKIYAIAKLKDAVKQEGLSDADKKLYADKIVVYNADVWGVQDMGYPYQKLSKEELNQRSKIVPQHLDMYCGEEPLTAN